MAARGINKVILVELYCSGMSIPQVAEATGVPQSTVRYHLLKEGVLRSRADGVRIAAKDGRLGSGLRGKTREFSEEWKAAISASKLKAAEATAKGVSLKPNGYLEYTRGEHKGKLVHRVVAEIHYGVSLTRSHHVHHVDGDKTNNAPENLQVMTASEHMAHHALENHENRERNSLGRFR